MQRGVAYTHGRLAEELASPRGRRPDAQLGQRRRPWPSVLERSDESAKRPRGERQGLRLTALDPRAAKCWACWRGEASAWALVPARAAMNESSRELARRAPAAIACPMSWACSMAIAMPMHHGRNTLAL